MYRVQYRQILKHSSATDNPRIEIRFWVLYFHMLRTATMMLWMIIMVNLNVINYIVFSFLK